MKYVIVRKPIIVKSFKVGEAPCGWVRIKSLQKRLNEDKEFRNQFTEKEIKEIMKIK